MFSTINIRKLVGWLTVTMLISFFIAFSIFAMGKSGLPLHLGYNSDDDIASSSNNSSNNNSQSSNNTNNSDRQVNSKSSGASSVDQNTISKVGGLSSINVKSVSSRINILPSDGQEVKAHLYGDAVVVPKLTSEAYSGNLNINVEYPIGIGVNLNFSDLTLDVEVPKSYSGDFSIDTVSGPVVINDFKFEKMTLKSVSGSLKAKNISAESTSINTTSGTVDLQNLKGNLYFRSVSGALTATMSDIASKADIKTTSGKVNISGLGSDLNFSSVSSGLTADFAAINGNIKLQSTSGALSLKLPASTQFKLDFKTTSGGFSNNFPIIMSNSDKHRFIGAVGNGGNQIQADTVSGSLEITKN